MGDIPNQIGVQPAPAVEGDFIEASYWRSSFPAGPGGLVAGASGVTVGRFAWVTSPLDGDNAPAVVNSFGAGAPSGFVHRDQQALITQYLGAASMLIQSGYQMALMNRGGFWVKNNGATQALIGQKAYADLTNGKATFAATGSPSNAASVTADVAAATFSVTGSIAGNIMTVTAVGSGTVVPGATVTGGAVGTKVVSQISGTAGGIGTYYVSIGEQAVASGTLTGTYGLMTVSAVGSGALVVGGLLSAGGTLTAFLTGTGGTGTYATDNNGVVGSTTITQTTNVETIFYAVSSGLAGELVKISDRAPTV